MTNKLLESALDELELAGVARDAVTVVQVPGAFELPLGAMALAKTRRYACIIALGCVIRGETPHFEYVAGEAASGLQLAALETGSRSRSACSRSSPSTRPTSAVAKGAEAVRTALEMADLFSQLRAERCRRSLAQLHCRAVSKVCAVCGKKPGFGNNRSHSMVATKRRFNPNLQRVRVLLDGKATRAYVCTRCLKGNKVQKAV